MEYSWISSILILLATYFGATKAKVTIDAPKTILSGQSISGSCVASGNMYARRMLFMRVTLVDSSDEANCTIKQIGRFQRIKHSHYQQNFNLTCNISNISAGKQYNSGNTSVGIKCFTHINNEIAKTYIQVIKPKIVTDPCNITTHVGLPITLTCHVEGDPDHYWVGWMTRNTIIRPGEEHSISTTPNFRSWNGTSHYLTVHEIKESGKFECVVYTMRGDVQDQLTHQVLVTEGNNEKSTLPSSSPSSSSSSSLFSILFSGLFS